MTTPQSVAPEALAFALAAIQDAKDLLGEALNPNFTAYRRVISAALVSLNEALEQLEGRAVPKTFVPEPACQACGGDGLFDYLGDSRIETTACASCAGSGRAA